MNQFAKGKQQKNTIHSPAQLEDYGCTVSDTPLKLGGHQAIITQCGFAIQFVLQERIDADANAPIHGQGMGGTTTRHTHQRHTVDPF
jgi:hypothetical protein